MPRKCRVEVPGGFYHVGTRGNDQGPVFFDDWNRRLFLNLIARSVKRHGWRMYAYCLMTNHYHLVLQLEDGGLSRGMCELNGNFAQLTNASLKRCDHLFGKRFWSGLIESDGHLLEAVRYVVLNPVRAGVCADPAEWPWSSHRAHLGLEHPPACLVPATLLRHFGADPRTAAAAYEAFVREGHVRCQAPV